MATELARKPAAWRRGARPFGRRRWRRWIGVGAGLMGLAVAGAGAFVGASYLLRSKPGARSVGSALQQFRQAAGGSAPSTQMMPATAARPAAGVYQLNGQGNERISFPPNSQTDGAIMPASVQYLPGDCWRWRVDYNTAHWEEYDFCVQGGTVREMSNRNGQRWDFGTTTISNRADFSCPTGVVILPPAPSPGQSFSQSCSGTNTAVAGTAVAAGFVNIVGTEQMSISGVPTKAVHELQRTTLTGSQTGSVVEDWWLESRTGLPLRVDRHITIGTKSPVGTITYTENGSWQMSSLTAQL